MKTPSSFPLKPSGVHLLIDPDSWSKQELCALFRSVPSVVRSVIVGGTYIHSSQFEATMDVCAETISLPIGNFLSAGPIDSLLSSRASFVLVPILFGTLSTHFVLDHLIQAAPTIKRLELTAFPMAYCILAGEGGTSTLFFTQSTPVPRGKPGLLRTLSLAATYLGLSGIYLEAGSAAKAPVRPEEVGAIHEVTELPILVGGGIDSALYCRELLDAGASAVVIGSAVENRRDLTWLEEL